MTEDQALLTVIAAHPDEDTPRLAYADWLDEHDRPDEAELIRVQCAIASLDSSSPEVRNRNVHLWKRQQDLLEYHRGALLGPLAGLVGPHDVVFDRGFLTEIHLEAKVFISHGEALTVLKPSPFLRVTGAASHLQTLATIKHSRLINALEMQATKWIEAKLFEPEAYRVFAEAVKHWPLHELDMEGCSLRDDSITELTNGDRPDWPLTILNLSQNEITDDGVQILVESSLFPRLKTLILGGNPLTDDSAHRLASAPGRLEELNLRFTNITAAGQHSVLRRKGTKVHLF